MKLQIVPDREEPEGGQIFADVGFDGHLQRCFLDTGATSTKVIADLFFSSYETTKTSEIAGLAGKRLIGQRIAIQNVSLGSNQLGPREVVRLPQGSEIVPTAGIDLFQDQEFTFDPANGNIVFESAHTEPAFDRGTAGHIVVTATSNGFELPMIWDTGAGLTTIDQKFIDEHPSLFRFINNSDVGDTVNAHAMNLKVYEAKDLRVESALLRKVKVLGADFTSIRKKLNLPNLKGALGYNFIIQFNWHFDMNKQKYSVG